jgi:putative membrane protein
MGLVGVGTIVHSCVDMVLSIAVWKVLIKNRSIAAVANVKEADLKFGKEKALQTTSKA